MPTFVKKIGNNPTGAFGWRNAADTTTIGAVTDLGAWTLGASGGSQAHTINGNSFTLTSQGQAILRLNAAGTAVARIQFQQDGTNDWLIGNSGTGAEPDFFFNNPTGGDVGVVSKTGQWVFGPNTGSGLDHLVQSGAGTTFSIKSGSGTTTPILYLNRGGTQDAAFMSAGAVGSGVTGSAVGDAIIGVLGGSRRLLFTPDFGATIAGIMSGTGAWQIGATGASSLTHKILGMNTLWLGDGGSLVFMNNSGGRTLGSCVTTLGSWTFGNSSDSAVHELASATIGNDMVSVRNYSSSASSDVRSCMQFVKGTNNVTTGQRYLRFIYGGGSSDNGYITATSSTTVGFTAVSDRRIKKDIVSLSGALEKLDQIRPVAYKLKSNDEDQVGFIAQELAGVFPRNVNKSDDGEGDTVPEGQEPWMVTEHGLIPWMIAAIKELKAEFDAYKAAHPVH